MKLPKIKLKKMSKKNKLRVLQWCSVITYSLGASLYGYFSYRAGQEDQWQYITDGADNSEAGSVIFHEGDIESRDNMYWVAGRKVSKDMWDTLQEMKEKDEQENS